MLKTETTHIIHNGVVKNQQSAYAKTKMQISFAVTDQLRDNRQLISVFVFATWIVQFLCFVFAYVDCWFSDVAAHLFKEC